MRIGKKEFDFCYPHMYIMGILNVTPDSFSDGGRFCEKDRAMYQVEKMIADGADLIDIGGESTRPGHMMISVEEEIERVAQVIEGVKERFDIPVSIDSYKAPVITASVKAGADMANDVWGLRYDEYFAREGEESVWGCKTMAQVIAECQIPVCIMHNRPNQNYTSFLDEVCHDLQRSVVIGKEAGIKKEQMILDPGIGFAKSYENNMQILANLHRFSELQLPMLLAASRKSVIGLTLDLPVAEREEGTLVTTVLAMQHRFQMVRVHDVQKTKRAIQMYERIRDFA